MEETVIPDPAKAFWQNMEHQQVEEIFTGDRSGLALLCFGIEIPESDHTVFAFQNILFLDNTPVKISAEIN
jgi:hypothetical protein